jgi:FtsP/CotA-like multicopper oxidase with cupredoxin domain
MCLVAVLLPSTRVGAAAAPITPDDPESGMTAGLPFVDPPDANLVAHPRLTITLAAGATRFDLSGRRVWGQSYNGSFVAPTLHLQPGQAADITLINRLPVVTNLHFHGLHVSPSGRADNPFISVPPGRSFRYHLAIPANHPVGTFWYHSHAMVPASGSRPASGLVEDQIFSGLSGAILIGDNRTALPENLRHIQTHTMVLTDVSIDSNAPTARLVNGRLRPVLKMYSGETQLWRLVNAGADIFYQLALDHQRFTVIGEDGIPVARVTHPETLLLPPGKRYDVLVTAGDPSSSSLRTTAYSNGPGGDSYPDVALVGVNVSRSRREERPDTMRSMPGAPANLAGAAIAQHRSLTLTEDEATSRFFINGKQFDMDRSVFSSPARTNTVEEWTIVNRTGEDHPFHLHNVSFQVTSVNGIAQPYTTEQDTVPVPHEIDGRPGQVVIRVPFGQETGRFMFHCHIAAHEDKGMMSFIDVVNPRNPHDDTPVADRSWDFICHTPAPYPGKRAALAS